MSVTPFYAALMALVFVLISLRVIALRRATGIALGDGDDRTLRRSIRAQANFAEYAPLALLLMALIELQGAPHWLLHALGTALLLGRLLHAWGIGREPEIPGTRVGGMALTFTALIAGALTALALLA